MNTKGVFLIRILCILLAVQVNHTLLTAFLCPLSETVLLDRASDIAVMKRCSIPDAFGQEAFTHRIIRFSKNKEFVSKKVT